jgi:hypothetical protein
VTLASAPPKTPDLQKQYEFVLQEYRFQVQLNWDRAKHFLIFNTAILAAAVALYKSGSTPIAKLGIAALMTLSALNSFMGRHAVAEAHRFYREIRDLKAKLEDKLGLGEYAIASTPGMKRGRGDAAEGTPRSGKGRARTINFQLQALLVIIGSVSAVGMVYAIYEATQPVPPVTAAPASSR